MIYIFGRELCSECQAAKKVFDGDGVEYKFIDLDEMGVDEMALAAYYGLLADNIELPVIVREIE